MDQVTKQGSGVNSALPWFLLFGVFIPGLFVVWILFLGFVDTQSSTLPTLLMGHLRSTRNFLSEHYERHGEFPDDILALTPGGDGILFDPYVNRTTPLGYSRVVSETGEYCNIEYVALQVIATYLTALPEKPVFTGFLRRC